MAEPGEPRTLLEAIVRQRQLSWDEAAAMVIATARKHEGTSISLSGRHLGRLARSERSGNRPNPATRRALQYAFGQPIDRLLAPYRPSDLNVAIPEKGTEPSEVLAVAADRARNFLVRLQTMSDESMELIHEDVRDLVRAYPTRPLSEIIGHLASAQDTVFRLLERPQRPAHARQLYFLSAVLGGLMAKASHDLADPHTALAQSRTAWLCAEQADHDGLRAWISGLQALVCYWAGRPHDSIRYIRRGIPHAERSRGTTSVWLPASEARAWAALGNAEQVRDAIARSEAAWAQVRADELDDMGGVATFGRARQLYYAADALTWLPDENPESCEEYASRAVEAYSDTTDPEWAFGDASGARADLALVRVNRGEIEGARNALEPVLSLPVEQRINGIIHSVRRVHRVLNGVSSVISGELQESIESYASAPVRILPR